VSIVNKIKKLVKKCHYGKDIKHLVASDTNFGVKYTSGESLEFINYMNKLQEKPPFKGTCEELAFSLAGYMEKSSDFKDYKICIVEGQCQKYFGTPTSKHVYLLLCPDSPKTDQLLEQSSSKTDLSFPKGALIIDPSFRAVLRVQEEGCSSRDGYTLDKITSREDAKTRLEEIGPKAWNKFSLSLKGPTSPWVPLGFATKLISSRKLQLPEKYKKALLFLEAKPGLATRLAALIKSPQERAKFSNTPSVEVAMRETPDSQTMISANDLLDLLPTRHPFYQFLRKIVKAVGSDCGLDKMLKKEPSIPQEIRKALRQKRRESRKEGRLQQSEKKLS
jgi:hypothetical protein